MVDICGEIPEDMVRQAKNREIFFDRHGTSPLCLMINVVGRLGDDIVPRRSSFERILRSLKSKSEMQKWYKIDLSPEEIKMVDDLLHKMLEISPQRRATAQELLQHQWLQI